jgi:hypothetical protein
LVASILNWLNSGSNIDAGERKTNDKYEIGRVSSEHEV